MKNIVAVVALLMAACAVSFAAQKTLAQLKAEVVSAKPKDQPKLYSEIAAREMEEAENLYSSGDISQGQAAVSDTAADCENAANAAISTRKRLKQTEIALRKISERMQALSKSADFENRPPIKAAVDRIEQLRNSLLNAMFKKK
jgi:hypothetical protein